MTQSNDTTPRGQDPLGSAVEEAMKLLDAVQRRMGREFGKGLVKGGLSGFGSAFGGAGTGGRGGDVWSEAVSEDHDEYICRACPVCRVIAARREAGGDVTDHLVAAGEELFAAFRQAVDALQRSATGGGARPAGERRSGDSTVEHIDLG
ncbi:hypothetical protein GCM10010116_18630 [Microbispora rosea subsp. aerata]|nr:DUF5304 family protein [Microbispora rosea]GGO09217.1 hypothetical protein GCM10010116_18630 [Microbispora rosea subsp. aerata]GIH53521.1 hypothetical protein Mro02_04350 [Microbispora rosea subsp. aerata]GLJ85430.1 hypothetical protein GCM10017588_41630 [Microbispora rosea subsp. aerata]